MQINEFVVKLSGRASIPQELKIGNAYKLYFDCAVTAETLHDNQDGTFDKVYSLKPVRAEIMDDKGEAIKTKDFRSESQKTRSLIKWEWEQRGGRMEFEKYYELMQRKIRDNIAAFAEEIEKNI
jgi:hypothetical protein